jgi:hypothetical protein
MRLRVTSAGVVSVPHRRQVERRLEVRIGVVVDTGALLTYAPVTERPIGLSTK